MPELYLTPSSISYLALSIQTILITAYLVSRSIGRGKRFSLRRDGALLALFVSLTLLALLYFFEYSFLPSDQVVCNFILPVLVQILLIALIQFAYDFPIPNGKYKIERWLVLLFSCYSLVHAAMNAFYRFARLQKGEIDFLFTHDFVILGIQFALVIFIFARSAIRNWKQPAFRNFALILMIPLGLTSASYFNGTNWLVTFGFPIALSIGLLLTVFLFTLNYLTSQPERVSFVVKISGAALTGMLAVFGVFAWLVAQPYADRYISPIQQLDHRTIHFSPDRKGGYTASEIPFQWEENYGQVLNIDDSIWDPNAYKYTFSYSLFGQAYQQVFVSRYCALNTASRYWGYYQYHFASTPVIMPLLVSLNAYDHPDGNFYVSMEDGRFLLTCLNLSGSYHPDAHYNMQTALFSDGSFNFSYNGLPELKFGVEDRPEVTAWAIGVKPDGATTEMVNFTSLPMQIGPQGAIQDTYRAFRIYMNDFLLPLAHAVFASSLALLIGAVLVLNYGLARPLNSLLKGVQNFTKGQRETAIPIQSNDEIGYLTESFNQVGGELNDLILSLEQRVADRTRELAAANGQLRAEMDARLTAQGQVMEQQRAVATLEERERLARELHDGIGQVLGFINVQGQSAIQSAQGGDHEASIQLLTRMVEVAQEAHDDVRGYILGLKREPSTQPRQDFWTQLEQYCQHLSQNFGFLVQLNLPEQTPPALAAKAVETQLLYVIREALSNARTHSGQKEAAVVITYDERSVRAVVEDYGAGFSNYGGPERRKSGHFGLGIMRERAEEVGGSLEIESAPGSGTRVTVILPRQPKAESKLGRRVLLVDDHPLFLEGMVNLMAGRGLTVVGTANDGLEAQAKARELRPEVILMDIEMPRCGGLEATRRIKAEMPDVKIVMLTVSGEERHLFEALQSGASGYLLKSLDAAELTALLEELLRGEVSISPSLAVRMMDAFNRHKAPQAQPPALRNEQDLKAIEIPAAAPAELTERQMEILRLVSQGNTYKEVAVQLEVAEVTVKYHMGEILTRLQLNNKRAAVQYFQDKRLK
jgi:DNA-binding NarL/FixJ family response regulator/signal transduction histidine kinase